VVTPTFRPHSLDHVALWVEDRAGLAAFLCDHLGMHVIEKTDSFTLVGIDAKLGKLTLFDAEGPRERGALKRVALRAGDLESVIERLPVEVERGEDGVAELDAPAGLRLGLVEDEGPEFDLDHIVLELAEPDSASAELERMGFQRRDGVLAVADRELRLERRRTDDRGRPLLNHVALLVDDALQAKDEAERGGLEVDDVKDAANTLAVFVRGPEGVRIEYVEHKPGFALV
jgi:catechol 2,3-dioxygenase-like lactoylglutathione lyase family enzyme